jgi:hypothetical protein
MATTAFQKQYRQEFIEKFEQGVTLLRKTTTTEAVIKGQTAEFLVTDTNGEEAVTRGENGLLPAKSDSFTAATCTLAEWHDLRRRTRFNIFAGQGDQRALMQRNSLKVVNRKIDADILAQLETGTQDTGAVQTMSLDLVTRAKAILGNNEIPIDGDVFCMLTPAALAYLEQTREFGSVEYTSNKPFDSANSGVYQSFRWSSVNWIVHPRLTGRGTSAEKCILYHRSAIGHAMDMETLQAVVGDDEEQDYSFARTTGYFGSKLLQNVGVVIINHDGSAMAAE